MQSVDGCITLRHKIMKRNCENETFTCRIKDQVLKDFGYSLNRVTVQKIKEGKHFIFFFFLIVQHHVPYVLVVEITVDLIYFYETQIFSNCRI